MSANDSYDFIQEQDRFLPIANVARIMRRVVPESGKLSKESKECVQECVTEFIQFVVAEASDRCTNEKRKTITCDDLLQALSMLSFEPYVDVLKVYIERYRRAAKNQSTDEAESSNAVAETSSNTTSSLRTTSLQPTDSIYIDSSTGQHYVRVEGNNGATFMPVTLSHAVDS